MDPELCPPWWPGLLWWLLHHHHHWPDPNPEEWLKELRRPVEEILVALTTYVEAQTMIGAKQEGLRGQMQEVALDQMNAAVEQLGAAAKTGGR